MMQCITLGEKCVLTVATFICFMLFLYIIYLHILFSLLLFVFFFFYYYYSCFILFWLWNKYVGLFNITFCYAYILISLFYVHIFSLSLNIYMPGVHVKWPLWRLLDPLVPSANSYSGPHVHILAQHACVSDGKQLTNYESLTLAMSHRQEEEETRTQSIPLRSDLIPECKHHTANNHVPMSLSPINNAGRWENAWAELIERLNLVWMKLEGLSKNLTQNLQPT